MIEEFQPSGSSLPEYAAMRLAAARCRAESLADTDLLLETLAASLGPALGFTAEADAGPRADFIVAATGEAVFLTASVPADGASVVAGFEAIVATRAELALMLRLVARATNTGEIPEQVRVMRPAQLLLVDGGRSVLAASSRGALVGCIGCGACVAPGTASPLARALAGAPLPEFDATAVSACPVALPLQELARADRFHRRASGMEPLPPGWRMLSALVGRPALARIVRPFLAALSAVPVLRQRMGGRYALRGFHRQWAALQRERALERD